VTQHDIFSKFSEFGRIQSCKLQCFPDGQSRGFAFVQYIETSEAQAAIAALNKQKWNGSVLEIDILKSQQERGTQEDNPNFTNLFVAGLEPGMTQKDLQQMFDKFGEIDSCTLKDETSNVGYVSFKKHEDAKTAMATMNKHLLPQGTCLIVSRFIYKQDNQLSKEGQLTPIAKNMKKTFDNNIFVNYIPLDVTEDQVKETFEVTGKVLQLRLTRKPNRTFQSAQILYADISAAQKAIQRFHDDKLFGSARPVAVDFWVSGEEQKQEHRQKNQQDLERLFRSVIS